ncbi:putative hypothetical protein associated with flagellum synthesis [Octadecabacter antarcticus 307]|uniref:Uncharacterized protein n=2 Tax=Octadecabacter TaxID=53945 RepID=M9R8G6_9RHOB|nr:putative hypothetical protein associated with flagellum synthesis [Octadecabacter antarcticus 307]
MLKNIALKEKARLPQLIKRQRFIQKDIDQLKDLVDRIHKLRDNFDTEISFSASRLQSDRWYELRLIDESQLLQNKLDFLTIELRDLTTEITRVSYKKQVVSNKADEVVRRSREDREARAEAALDFIHTNSRLQK